MKTELEKMLAGDLYVANDPELTAMRNRARTLFLRYNQTPYDAEPDGPAPRRQAILRQLLGGFGETLNIQGPFFCDYGVHITIGEKRLCQF